MKIGSIKMMAFSLSFLILMNATGNLSAHEDSSKHQRRRHVSKCEIPIPNTNFTEFALRISTDLHTQNRGLDLLISAEAFAPKPIPFDLDSSTTPSRIIVTEPHLVQLIQAVDSTTAFGRNDLISILNDFGINGKPLADSLFNFLIAGEQYSVAVANHNVIPSVDPYLAAWYAAGIEVGNQIARVLKFKHGSAKFNRIQKLVQDVVTDESNGVLGLNELLPPSALKPGETQAGAALRYFIIGRAATTTIGDIMAKRLVFNYNRGRCKTCEKL